MSKFTNQLSTVLVNTCKYLSLVSVVGMVASSLAIPANAAYDAANNRYNDSLNNPHQEAVYVYNYENTAPDAAPGYFQIPLGAITGANPDALLEVTSITDTFPVDATTYVPASNAQTITTNPASAVFVASGVMNIKLSPQIACVAASGGGCTSGNIPAAVPGKITIKMSLKTSAPTTPSILDGQGKIYFPNGFDINSIGWRINASYVKTNDVLDPSVMPTATIQGQGGTGTPTIGQPYTVVTTGIKAVDGNPLNAPNGTCKTTISGTTYTGNGITNGTCTVAVPVNATSAAIPAGTVNLNDGGTPRPIVLNSVPYSSVTPGQGSSPLVTADIPGLTVSCTSAAVNSTTTCTFTLPANKTLPADFKLGAGDSTPAGSCTASGSNVTCTNVPTGTQTGLQPINGQIGTNPKTDTGEKVQINPATKTGENITIVTPTNITDADLTKLGFSCGVSNTVTVSSTTTCTGTLPANKLLDPTNPLKLSIGDATGLSDACTLTNTTITCNNVPTGSQTGSIPVKAKLGSGPLTDTTQKVTVVGAQTNAPNVKYITDADLPNIGTGNANDPFSSLTCGASDVVKAGGTTTCFGTLKDGWAIPAGFKFGVGTNPGGTCTQSGQNIFCTNVPVTATAGNNVPVKAQIDNGPITDTGKRVSVQAVAVALARTGGAALIGLGVAMLAGLAGFLAYTRYSKINAKSTKLN
jgi:hypothetical protein